MRAVLLVFLLCFAAPVAAQEAQNPDANRHFHQGLSAFEAGDYATATHEFEAAYKIEPSLALLWSWAQAERKSGHCDKALPLYRKYRENATTASQVKYATENIDECDRALPPPWYKNQLGSGLTIGGLGGVALGITFFAVSSSKRSAADDQMYLDDFEAKLDSATTWRRMGAVSVGIGVGLLAAGAYVYTHPDRREQRVVAGTDGRTVFVGARF